MFTLTISGCCNGCMYSDLELLKNDIFFRLSSYNIPQYSLRCRHQDVCGALAKEAEEHYLALEFED